MINDKKSVIVVAGPTGNGKTNFAVQYSIFLRKKFSIESEIINADSVQLYDELKIITAFPTDDTRKQVKHHLYGILSPYENSSAAFWMDLALQKIDQLHRNKKTAILCGGTGFYISALINGLASIPKIPQKFRDEILDKFQTVGREVFFKELLSLDPLLAERLHKNDTQRILRAYEVVAYTKKPLSVWWQNQKRYADNISVLIALPPREELNKMCLSRINEMIKNGAVEEVEHFTRKYPLYDGPLCDVIGYKEILSFLRNDITKQKCVDLMYLKTRQYAKRQSTWFRNQFPQAKIMRNFDEMFQQLSLAELV